MIELRIIHDGRHWVASHESWVARSTTLPGLDNAVRAELLRTEQLSPGDRLQVRMCFDNSVIPQWIRQYSNHYFNRLVTIEH